MGTENIFVLVLSFTVLIPLMLLISIFCLILYSDYFCFVLSCFFVIWSSLALFVSFLSWKLWS